MDATETFQSTGSSRSPTFSTTADVNVTLFQSTGSSRSPTAPLCVLSYSIVYFNPQAPRGARHPEHCLNSRFDKFQPTGSSRSPTGGTVLLGRTADISTHRLLAEPDPGYSPFCTTRRNFNPQAPRGARPCLIIQSSLHLSFQPTGSSRSPTAILYGAMPSFSNFNPQAPRGARQQKPLTFVSFLRK